MWDRDKEGTRGTSLALVQYFLHWLGLRVAACAIGKTRDNVLHLIGSA
jgi:hypothetical protein